MYYSTPKPRRKYLDAFFRTYVYLRIYEHENSYMQICSPENMRNDYSFFIAQLTYNTSQDIFRCADKHEVFSIAVR